jgi:hypothetical protein
MNIRNCYLVATQEELENEIEHRLDKEDFLAVRFLRELKDEVEVELHSYKRKALDSLKGAETVAMDVPVGLGKNSYFEFFAALRKAWYQPAETYRVVCSNGLGPR